MLCLPILLFISWLTGRHRSICRIFIRPPGLFSLYHNKAKHAWPHTSTQFLNSVEWKRTDAVGIMIIAISVVLSVNDYNEKILKKLWLLSHNHFPNQPWDQDCNIQGAGNHLKHHYHSCKGSSGSYIIITCRGQKRETITDKIRQVSELVGINSC